MAVRLIVTMTAAPGKAAELASAYRDRCADISKARLEQFEVFQSVVNPEKLVILERWSDQKALDVHAEVNKTVHLSLRNFVWAERNGKTTSTTARVNRLQRESRRYQEQRTASPPTPPPTITVRSKKT